MEPHYGCPKCGCARFSASQDITEYCTQTAYCTFTSDEVPEYDIEETDNRECYDSDAGDVDDLKHCRECGHEYTTPTYFGQPNTLEAIAERSGLTARDISFLADAFATLPHSLIMVRQEAHALLIDATARSVPRDRWKVSACARCNAEMDEPRYHIRQVYRHRPGGLTDREAVYDRRLLPVLVKASLCTTCR